MPTTWTTVTDPIGDTGAFDSRMIFGDFDGDGDIDILFQNGNTSGTGIGYMRNDGNGTFTTFTDATAVGSIFAGVDLSGRQITPANFFILDFDGDGDLDILDRTSNTTTFFQNNGNSSYTRISDPVPDTGAFDQRMVWGDFDGDGDVDALYQNGNTAGSGIGYLRNDGGLSFTNFTSAAASGTPFTGVDFSGLQITTSTFVVDVNDDGDLDILDRGATQVMYQNNGGSFSRVGDPLADIGAFDARMIFGDFDSDGDIDAIYQNGNTAGAGFGYFRNDNGTFVNNTTLTGTPFAGLDLTGQQLTTWIAVDIDNDGDVDIIDRDQAGGGLVMYRQNGAPPRISSSTPSDNGTGVSTTANIVLTFSESVTKGNGNIYIYRGDGVLIETIAVTSVGQVTGSGTTWTIDPSVTLAGGTNYYVLIDQETFADGEGAVFAGIYNSTTLNFTTAVANTAPTFTNLNGDTPAYTEDGAAVRLDVTGNATVADTEQANFNGGTLTVAITAGGTSGEDVLSVANIGTSTGQISVSGGNISYQGVQIGTFTGGTGGANLVITLDSDATVAATQALVRALQYSNSNGANPSTTGRTVTVVLTDGAGGTSATQTVTVGVSAVNDAPTFTNLTGDTPAYTEGGAAVRLDVGGNATVADVDNANFNGGTLTVAITAGGTAAQDALSVANIGTGAGQISVSGANISYQGVQIATFTGGTSGANLVITLDSDATPAATQALVRALQYLNTNTDNPSTANRTVTVTLTDGSGGTAAVQSLTLGVSGVNDAAVITAGDTPTYTEGGAAVAVSPTLTIADVDSANMTGATITISDFRTGDTLIFVNQNGITGSYNSGTGVLTLSGSATLANYQAALRSITYSGAADANFGGTDLARTVNFSVTDGTVSNTATATITIADAPSGPTPGDDNLPGTAGDDSISGLDGDDTIDGGDGDDYLNGGDGDDELFGGANNDYLKGGAGADHMVGGAGNDFYVVDNVGDTPDETGGDGIDTVATTISWTLGVGFENLTLGASGGTINGTGNSLDNVINGNYAANTLMGLAGADTLNGAGGNDFLYGGDDIDTLDGGTQDDFLDGGAGNDILIGGLGADFLRGGTGADAMSGGAGNDIYEVDNVGDTTDETGGSGIDEVRAFITWTLSTDIEKLTLEATGGAINGTGNALANTITGNASANTLSGLDGADLLYGMGGNDVLLGGLAADKLYGGDDDDQLQGGAGNDQLFGDNGHDTLIGGLGSDNLTGGSGHDVFAFVNDDLHIGTPLEQDRVLDFSLADGDRIDLSAIDANTILGGDQAFSIVSTFSNTAGEMKLFYRTGSNQTQVLLDVNGDGVADHEILINGNVTGMGVLTGGEPITQGGWIL